MGTAREDIFMSSEKYVNGHKAERFTGSGGQKVSPESVKPGET